MRRTRKEKSLSVDSRLWGIVSKEKGNPLQFRGPNICSGCCQCAHSLRGHNIISVMAQTTCKKKLGLESPECVTIRSFRIFHFPPRRQSLSQQSNIFGFQGLGPPHPQRSALSRDVGLCRSALVFLSVILVDLTRTRPIRVMPRRFSLLLRFSKRNHYSNSMYSYI